MWINCGWNSSSTLARKASTGDAGFAINRSSHPHDIPSVTLFEQAARRPAPASTEAMTFDPLANRLVFEMVFKPHFNTADPLPDDTLRLTLVDLFYIPYMHHLERTNAGMRTFYDEYSTYTLKLGPAQETRPNPQA
ncbi:hypothetical protein EYZ11_005652 [Aspergillus tanneri]|uniref:Uncharacterized protein n=1 Tax=Aspergillus tanneri TaxID=1220188 RepID=A0A4S3JNB9_9EURO|nr:hypothetical protein EYZ11_005652 [Aspergillus tanneri]